MAASTCLCAMTAPAWRAKSDRSSNSFGVSLISRPARVTRWRTRDLELADPEHGDLGVTLHAMAHRGAHSRHQLADAERLVDEIIRAEVERLDLLAFAIARR